MSDDPIRQAETCVNAACEQLGIDACTFNVLDPFWSSHFHLLFAPGVSVRVLGPPLPSTSRHAGKRGLPKERSLPD